MQSVRFLPALCVFLSSSLCSGLLCGEPPSNQLFRDEVNANTDCGTECGKMCFQKVVSANIYFKGDFAAIVGASSATFLEECVAAFVQDGHGVTCDAVSDDKGSIKVVVNGPEQDVFDARTAARDLGIDLQSFAQLFVEPFDSIRCTRFAGNEKTCWADTAWGECGPGGGGGGQKAYDLIMAETDVRKQYLLREGCGNLVPVQCLAAGGASSAFQGATCAEVLRGAICVGDTAQFRTCVGQGQCSCPAVGEVGYAKGNMWGIGSTCSGAACQAGCAVDGKAFTGGALTTTQLSTLASKATDGETKLVGAMDKLAAHIGGTSVLSNTDLATESGRFDEFAQLLKRTPALVKKALDLVDTYESSAKGPLFVAPRGPFDRVASTVDGHELERAMLLVQQAILDKVYRAGVLAECSRAVFAGREWQTAAYYPGAAPPPADDTVVHKVMVKASVPASWGKLVIYAHDHAQKPTGLYLSPGAIGVVTVPPSLVGKGYQVLVGAQVSDNKRKSQVRRMDRVTATFEVTSATTLIANPLGGGVYLMVPYLADEGLVEVQISGGVIQAPFFRQTSFHKMSNAEWSTRRTAPAPWADFETDLFMLNVPRAWIYAYADPESLMNNYDKSMTGAAEWLGYPAAYRTKKVAFLGVDLHIKASAYGVGYPQVNNLYNAGQDYGGNHNHWMLRDPAPGWATCYHELGHAQLMSMYPGETEAINNFMYTFIAHTQFGVKFDKAFDDSMGVSKEPTYSPDGAASHWMVTQNFRAGKEMDHSSTEFDQMRYQHRGYAKYADIVRLFGWEAFTSFYNKENIDFNAGTYEGGGSDGRTLRFSVAAGFDLRPLIHFWGVLPSNEASLATKVQNAGLPPSEQIRCLLERYKTIIPASNTQFKDFYKTIYPTKTYKSTDNPLYGNGWYEAQSKTYGNTEGVAGVARVDALLQKYFPTTKGQSCVGVQTGKTEVAVPVKLGVPARSNFTWMPTPAVPAPAPSESTMSPSPSGTTIDSSPSPAPAPAPAPSSTATSPSPLSTVTPAPSMLRSPSPTPAPTPAPAPAPASTAGGGGTTMGGGDNIGGGGGGIDGNGNIGNVNNTLGADGSVGGMGVGMLAGVLGGSIGLIIIIIIIAVVVVAKRREAQRLGLGGGAKGGAGGANRDGMQMNPMPRQGEGNPLHAGDAGMTGGTSLPVGWVATTDPSSGQLYYYNAESGTTTWDRPTTASANGARPVSLKLSPMGDSRKF